MALKSSSQADARPGATGEDDISAVRRAERERLEAMSRHDDARLGELLAEDFTYAHSNGTVDTKASLLEKVRSRATAWEDPHILRSEVRIYGDTAVVNGHFTLTVRRPDGTSRLNSLSLAVWVRQGGDWRLAATASTPLPPETPTS